MTLQSTNFPCSEFNPNFNKSRQLGEFSIIFQNRPDGWLRLCSATLFGWFGPEVDRDQSYLNQRGLSAA
jgi:hypothetical protein